MSSMYSFSFSLSKFFSIINVSNNKNNIDKCTQL